MGGWGVERLEGEDSTVTGREDKGKEETQGSTAKTKCHLRGQMKT